MKIIKSNRYLTLGAVALLAGFASVADAKGPKFSVNVEAFCGDEADAVGAATNVAVILTDESDDNGPTGALVGNLEVVCTAAVKMGRGRPNDVVFGTINIPAPAFGLNEVECPLAAIPEGAREWKATATVSGGDLARPRKDTCEEVPLY